MRIAMVSTPFVDVPPRRYGGTELVIHALCEGLAQKGHEIVLFATRGSRIQGEVRSLFQRAVWPPDLAHDLAHLSFAFRSIRDDPLGFDAVHVHSAYALPLARVLGIPVVHTLHHVHLPELSSIYTTFQDHTFFVAISHRQKELELPFRHSIVIHHGLNPGHYPLGEGGEFFFFLGRLSKCKGCHTAIDVVRDTGKKIVVAGASHWEGEGLEEAVYFEKELRWRLALPFVEYVGEVGPSEKIPLLQRSLALLCPIEWEEPFGLVVIEAMLCGTPVIGYPRGALPELIEPGLTGFLVRDEKELKECIPEVCRLDRRTVRRRAQERFHHLRMTEEYLALYQRVAALGKNVLVGTSQEAATV